MAENTLRSRFAPHLPNRVTAVAALFVGWGTVHLLAAYFNAGSSSTVFFVEWFAVLGGFSVISGWLLYRRHWVGAPAGLVALGAAFLSNIYQMIAYSLGLLDSGIGVSMGIQLVLIYVLVTIVRNQ
jgi:hypothetical protein